jgi:hypothetical protein
MPRRKTSFDQVTITRIVEAAGGQLARESPDGFQRDLEGAATDFQLWGMLFDNAPSASKRRKTLDDIDRHSKRLAKVLGVIEGESLETNNPYLFSALVRLAGLYAERFGPYHDVDFPPDGRNFPVPDYGEDEAVRRASEGVWRLHEWVKFACQESDDSGIDLRSAKGPSAEMWLIGKKLPAIYEYHFNRPFRISKPSGRKGEPYGPAIRFTQAVLAVLGIKKSPDAIEKMYDRYRQQWDNPPKK